MQPNKRAIWLKPTTIINLMKQEEEIFIKDIYNSTQIYITPLMLVLSNKRTYLFALKTSEYLGKYKITSKPKGIK